MKIHIKPIGKRKLGSPSGIIHKSFSRNNLLKLLKKVLPSRLPLWHLVKSEGKTPLRRVTVEQLDI